MLSHRHTPVSLPVVHAISIDSAVQTRRRSHARRAVLDAMKMSATVSSIVSIHGGSSLSMYTPAMVPACSASRGEASSTIHRQSATRGTLVSLLASQAREHRSLSSLAEGRG